ncbi:MAG: ChrR family anti-sigma-E factor [Marivibrio sp.]|uniref:ChrR family anti-sigma-E factor n=1 Tax=Marivibrio sp. TaxID=2039719 RepID=UPI0032EDF17F
MSMTAKQHHGATRSVGGGAPGRPTHHLNDELLLDYAAGACDEAVSVLVASHLTLCPDCRARADHLDAVGGEMMAALKPQSMADDALERLMKRLDEPAAPAEPAAVAPPANANESAVLPRVLQRYVGPHADQIAWKPLGLGVDHFELPLDGDGASRAVMLRVPPGRAVPQHTHEGNEYVLVLQGGFSDQCGHFGRGDVESADSSVDHRPVADPGEACICLAVLDGPMRLTSVIGRALNHFIKF